MGTAKNQMTKKSTTKKTEGKSLKDMLGFTKRTTRKEKPSEKTFAEKLEELENDLCFLIALKEDEYKKEKNEKAYNNEALGVLRTMGYHLDCMIDEVEKYNNLKK